MREAPKICLVPFILHSTVRYIRDWIPRGWKEEEKGRGTEKRTGKSLDLFSNDIDPAIIAGVEFENHLTHVFRTVDSSSKGEDSGCFAGAGWAVQEEMREALS